MNIIRYYLLAILSFIAAVFVYLWGGPALVLWVTFLGSLLYICSLILTRSHHQTFFLVANYLALLSLSQFLWWDYYIYSGSALAGSDDTYFYETAMCYVSSQVGCRQEIFSYFLYPFFVVMTSLGVTTDIGVYPITAALTALNFSLCSKFTRRVFSVRLNTMILYLSYFAIAHLFLSSLSLFRETLVTLFLFSSIYVVYGSKKVVRLSSVMALVCVAILRVASTLPVLLFWFMSKSKINSWSRASLIIGVAISCAIFLLGDLAHLASSYGSSATRIASRSASFATVSGEEVLERRMLNRVGGSQGAGVGNSAKADAYSSLTPSNLALRFLIPTLYPLSLRDLRQEMSARHIFENLSIVTKPFVLTLLIFGLMNAVRSSALLPLIVTFFLFGFLVAMFSGQTRHFMPLYWLVPSICSVGWYRLRGVQSQSFCLMLVAIFFIGILIFNV